MKTDEEYTQKIVVEIEWDTPEEPFWLNADNVSIALHSYCTNTNFKVTQIDEDEE